MAISSSRVIIVALAGLLTFAHNLYLPGQSIASSVDKLYDVYDVPGSPGCSVGVIKDGSLVYRRAHGLASLELNVPLSPESVFYMGSVSKQFTAASVVLAAEMGLLTLDDDVHRFIPELPNYGRPITLRQMLHQTSGFKDFFTLLYLAGQQNSGFHAREVLDLVVRQKSLNNVPGEEFIYSNTNYFLLSIVIERATKQSLAEFASEHIFKPLGMAHTRFDDDRAAVVPNRVPAYDPGQGGTFVSDWSSSFDIVGAGGLMSNVDDLLLWDKNFYQNKLGKGALTSELESPGVLNDGHKITYALGLELGAYRGWPTVEHNGSLFGYRTEVLRFPKQRLSIVCLCNLSSAPAGALSLSIADLYLPHSSQVISSRSSVSIAERLPSASGFAGEYLDQRTRTVFSFSAVDGELAGWGTTLRRLGPNTFHDLGTGTITFDGSKDSMSATLSMDGEKVFVGTRVSEVHLSNDTLASLTGTYRSSELDVSYRLSLEKGVLVLRSGSGSAIVVRPMTASEFMVADLGTLFFTRDYSDRISGLIFSAVNARGILFTKML